MRSAAATVEQLDGAGVRHAGAEAVRSRARDRPGRIRLDPLDDAHLLIVAGVAPPAAREGAHRGGVELRRQRSRRQLAVCGGRRLSQREQRAQRAQRATEIAAQARRKTAGADRGEQRPLRRRAASDLELARGSGEPVGRGGVWPSCRLPDGWHRCRRSACLTRQPTSSSSLKTSPIPMLSAGLVPFAQSGSRIGELVTRAPSGALVAVPAVAGVAREAVPPEVRSVGLDSALGADPHGVAFELVAVGGRDARGGHIRGRGCRSRWARVRTRSRPERRTTSRRDASCRRSGCRERCCRCLRRATDQCRPAPG